MTVRSRQTKVLITLLFSIILGAIILNALGHNPPSAGAFCLSRYYRLAPVEKSILSRAAQFPGLWKRIEIYYSDSYCDNAVAYGSNRRVEQLNSLGGITDHGDIGCHFIICNGQIGRDGQIQPTKKWKKQLPINPESPNQEQSATDNGQTIYISIIADGKTAGPTNIQIKRTEALVEQLCRKFNIQPESVLYPSNWG